MNMSVGVLGFHGGIEEHLMHLESIGVKGNRIITKDALMRTTHLIIPGGESSVIGKLLEINDMEEQIKERVHNKKMAIWGTCAGAILCAKQGSPYSLGIIDIEVERNAYGRQKDSFTSLLSIDGISDDFTGVFIRAPKILTYGSTTEVLAMQGDTAVACRNTHVLVTTFHPELTASNDVHKYFLKNFNVLL